MIRQPKRMVLTTNHPLIELIMQDMELPILEHTGGNALRDARGNVVSMTSSHGLGEHRLYS